LILRLVGAMALGAVIGLEREYLDKPAGLRTLMMVSLGPALFSLIVLELMGVGALSGGSDSSRVIAAIIQGIGFLCAGTVFRVGDTVKGLTTAAAMWAVTAIGVEAGFGLWRLALLATGATLVVLRGLARVYPHQIG
jgi:putative Mg2+ transporter-C (MgtC) family protein